jgi:hypothetical protein
LLPTAVVAALIVGLLLLVATISPALLLHTSAALLQAGHRHPAGKAADEVLHVALTAADKTLRTVAGLEHLLWVGETHLAKSSLTRGAAEVAGAAADAAAHRSIAKHAADATIAAACAGRAESALRSKAALPAAKAALTKTTLAKAALPASAAPSAASPALAPG